MLPAAIVLAIMILPTISAISRDALATVPPKLREAAYGLGATRWEAIMARDSAHRANGIFGSIVLAFGRALGETMALAMLVGNANKISWSLFSPANTLAALLANTFPEAGTDVRSVLMYAALVLMAITLLVNILGTLILSSSGGGREPADGRHRSIRWGGVTRPPMRPATPVDCDEAGEIAPPAAVAVELLDDRPDGGAHA